MSKIEIKVDILEKIIDLPSDISRLVLSWGYRCYLGEIIFIDDEYEKDKMTSLAIDMAEDLFDQDAIALGIIDVHGFHREHQEDVSEVEQYANIVPLKVYAGGKVKQTRRTNRELLINKDDAEHNAAVESLASQGVSLENARVIVEKFSKDHHPSAILEAALKMQGRGVLSPERYLASCLSNGSQAGLSEKIRGPKPIRKQVAVNRDGVWEFLGWTSEESRHAGKGRNGRRKVWRTDSGRLSYKLPDENETVPDFSEDPGVMEVE